MMSLLETPLPMKNNLEPKINLQKSPAKCGAPY